MNPTNAVFYSPEPIAEACCYIWILRYRNWPIEHNLAKQVTDYFSGIIWSKAFKNAIGGLKTIHRTGIFHRGNTCWTKCKNLLSPLFLYHRLQTLFSWFHQQKRRESAFRQLLKTCSPAIEDNSTWEEVRKLFANETGSYIYYIFPGSRETVLCLGDLNRSYTDSRRVTWHGNSRGTLWSDRDRLNPISGRLYGTRLQ